MANPVRYMILALAVLAFTVFAAPASEVDTVLPEMSSEPAEGQAFPETSYAELATAADAESDGAVSAALGAPDAKDQVLPEAAYSELATADASSTADPEPTIRRTGCGAPVCAYYYKGIPGTAVSKLTESTKYKQGKPDQTDMITTGLFKTKDKYADNYGVMLEGWLIAPFSGKWVFITQSDDSSEVWVGTKPDRKDSLKKAVELKTCCKSVTGTVEFDFVKGKSYYVKGLMKEGIGGDYFKIGIKSGSTQHMPVSIKEFNTNVWKYQTPSGYSILPTPPGVNQYRTVCGKDKHLSQTNNIGIDQCAKDCTNNPKCLYFTYFSMWHKGQSNYIACRLYPATACKKLSNTPHNNHSIVYKKATFKPRFGWPIPRKVDFKASFPNLATAESQRIELLKLEQQQLWLDRGVWSPLLKDNRVVPVWDTELDTHVLKYNGYEFAAFDATGPQSPWATPKRHSSKEFQLPEGWSMASGPAAGSGGVPGLSHLKEHVIAPFSWGAENLIIDDPNGNGPMMVATQGIDTNANAGDIKKGLAIATYPGQKNLAGTVTSRWLLTDKERSCVRTSFSDWCVGTKNAKKYAKKYLNICSGSNKATCSKKTIGQVLGALECNGWRQTKGCNGYGVREKQHDMSCNMIVKNGRSGYCECVDAGGKIFKKNVVGCKHSTIHGCTSVCRGDPPYGKLPSKGLMYNPLCQPARFVGRSTKQKCTYRAIKILGDRKYQLFDETTRLLAFRRTIVTAEDIKSCKDVHIISKAGEYLTSLKNCKQY